MADSRTIRIGYQGPVGPPGPLGPPGPSPAGTGVVYVVNGTPNTLPLGPAKSVLRVNAAGTALEFFLLDAPRFQAIMPNDFITDGGTAFTMQGKNFTGVFDIFFNGASAPDFVVVNDTLITGHAPAGTEGICVITIQSAEGVGSSPPGENLHFIE